MSISTFDASTSITAAEAQGQDRTALRLPRSRAHCRAIVRTRAANFYYGMRLVSEPKRSGTYALYAWLREADDIADGEGTTDERLVRLEQFWQATMRTLDGAALHDAASFWPAFREVVACYRLPVATLRDHFSGQLLDQRKFAYATFDELYDYCRRVASTVGVMCIDIWGYDGSAEARQLAEWRGVALQLTNVLRDVREDAMRGRVYLPQDGPDGAIDPHDLLHAEPGENRLLHRMPLATLHDLVAKAREYYERSAPLEQLVHADGRSGLWAMTQIYRGLLERIAARPESVLTGRRVSLPCWRKVVIAVQAVTR